MCVNPSLSCRENPTAILRNPLKTILMMGINIAQEGRGQQTNVRKYMKILNLLVILSILTACGKSAVDANPIGFGSSNPGTDEQQPKIVAPTCFLDKPVLLAGNPLEKTQKFSNVILDQEVQNAHFKSESWTALPMKLRLFNIQYGHSLTENLGASIDAVGGGYIGFADIYEGSFDIVGSSTKNGSTTIFNTTDSSGKSSETTLKLQIEGNNVVGIQLSHPILEIKDGSSVYSGKFQTICVKSMSPDNS